MPETVQSYIASSAKFENSQIDVSPIATLGTLNKVGYTLSLWAKLNGDVVAASPGIKEYIFDGSFNDDQLDPLDSGKGFQRPVLSRNLWTANEDLNFNGGQVNTRSETRPADTLGLAYEGLLEEVHQSKQVIFPSVLVPTMVLWSGLIRTRTANSALAK